MAKKEKRKSEKKSEKKKVEKKEKRWLLLQARIVPEAGRELRALAAKEGLPPSAYVRRLVMQHLSALRPVLASVATSPVVGADGSAGASVPLATG